MWFIRYIQVYIILGPKNKNKYYYNIIKETEKYLSIFKSILILKPKIKILVLFLQYKHNSICIIAIGLHTEKNEFRIIN